jgi:hypothetical protein
MPRPLPFIMRAAVLAILALGASLAAAPAARADIDAWYYLTSPVGPGTGIASVTQGGPGQRLILHVENTAEPIRATIEFRVSIPLDDACYVYAVDLVAPIADNVGVNWVELLEAYDLDFDGDWNVGPGPVIYGLYQISFDLVFIGEMTLFKFELEITPPVDGDIALHSANGPIEWINWDGLPPPVRYADAEPLLGNTGSDVLTSTPSIVVTLAGDGGGPVDCNDNQIDDAKEISNDPSLDCNSNNVIDSCEIDANPSLDCNGNGVLDSCEIAADAGLDCNSNSLIDACEIDANPTLDCNVNDIIDSCEIAADPTLDCNENGALDACELAANQVEDCNDNNVPDSCDVAGGASADANENGTPDECEPAPPLPNPDVDGDNGTPDDDSNGGSTPHRLIDRTLLRNFLRLIFGITGDDGMKTPLAALTLYGLNFYGLPLAAVQATFELISLPVRMFIYEVTYAILDCLLP